MALPVSLLGKRAMTAVDRGEGRFFWRGNRPRKRDINLSRRDSGEERAYNNSIADCYAAPPPPQKKKKKKEAFED